MNGRIDLRVGNRGSGKSRDEVEEGYYHLRAGGWWYTNIEVYPDEIERQMAEEGYKFAPERLVALPKDCEDWHLKIARGTPKSLVRVSIDEGHFKYDAKDHAKTPKDDRAFFTLARKLDIHLVFISQRTTKIDKVLRDDVDMVITHKDLASLRLFGVAPFPWHVFVIILADTINGKLETRGHNVKLNREWTFRLFNSDALLGSMAQRLGNLEIKEAVPLERIPKKKPVEEPESWLPAFAALCASLFVSF